MNTCSFLIEGKVKDSIIHKVSNFRELSQGQWLISIQSMSLKSTAEIATLCALSCNFSQTTKFTKNSERLQIEQIFGVFEIKTSSRKPLGIIQNSK